VIRRFRTMRAPQMTDGRGYLFRSPRRTLLVEQVHAGVRPSGGGMHPPEPIWPISVSGFGCTFTKTWRIVHSSQSGSIEMRLSDARTSVEDLFSLMHSKCRASCCAPNRNLLAHCQRIDGARRAQHTLRWIGIKIGRYTACRYPYWRRG